MHNDIERILISEEVLQKRIRELAAQVSSDYAGKNPIFVGVLKGVVLFYGDMIKRIDTHCQIDFMWISSYAGTDSTGCMIWNVKCVSSTRANTISQAKQRFADLSKALSQATTTTSTYLSTVLSALRANLYRNLRHSSICWIK